MTQPKRTRPLLVALLLAGCYNPDTSKIIIVCDPQSPCPDGGLMDSGDGDLPTNPDDLMSADGCKTGDGDFLGDKARACKGKFAAGGAGDLCAPGWGVCQNSTGIDIALCNALDGFYAANVPGYWITPNRKTPACSASTGTNALMFGCGKLQSYAADNMTGISCSGFGRSVDCSAAATVWKCAAPFDIAHTSNNEGMDGVLCCKG